MGSVAIWDKRTLHCGTANTGDRDRPVLFATFCRRWATEYVPPNVPRYDKLLMSRSEHAGFDDRMRHVMARAKFYD